MPKRQESGTETIDVELKNNLSKEVLFSRATDTNFPVELENVKNSAQVARVTLMGGITKNMGDFESLRINVQLELPCRAEPDKLEEAYEYAKTWIGDKINLLTEEAVGNMQAVDGAEY